VDGHAPLSEGARSSYSNEGFVVLGAVVEKVSGRSYDEHLREHVFSPAAMIDTNS